MKVATSWLCVAAQRRSLTPHYLSRRCQTGRNLMAWIDLGLCSPESPERSPSAFLSSSPPERSRWSRLLCRAWQVDSRSRRRARGQV